MLTVKILSPFLFLAMRIISLVVYVLTIIAAFGGRINPEFLTFPSLLCLALPYFAILTLILTVFWGIFRKIFFCALGIVTIFICINPLSQAFPLGSPRNPVAKHETFKIMSWNVIHTWDLRDKEYKGNRAVEYMINSGADVICLAELYNFGPNELHDLSRETRDSLFSLYPYREGKESSAIKLMSKYPAKRLDMERLDYKGECRYDFFEIDFPENKKLVVAMVHLYSYGLSDEERDVVTEINSVETAKTSMREFKGSIRQKLRKAFQNRAEDAEALRSALDDISPDIPLIVCGDFNDVPASWTYNIVRGDDLRDAYQETNFGPAITYNLHAFYFHIDQMFYRGPLLAIDLKIGKINSSDHYPLIGEFEFK